MSFFCLLIYTYIRISFQTQPTLYVRVLKGSQGISSGGETHYTESNLKLAYCTTFAVSNIFC